MPDSIKMINAALDEEGSEIILRGVIDPVSLQSLLVDDYQREILPSSRIRELVKGFDRGGVPDIELGMRGGSFIEREGNFYLQNQVYIIDGLQRRTAAVEFMRTGKIPRLGATVHFNTSAAWERERFRMLNVSRAKLSANVLLRNERAENPAIEMLFTLCKDSTFALHNRVSWQQNMRRDHLIGGNLLAKSAMALHRRFHANLMSTDYRTSAEALKKLMAKVGRTVVRENIKRYWECLDACFDVRATAYAVSAPYLRGGFLQTLGSVFSYHRDFWADANLDVPREIQKKLATFPIRDPHISSLCSASGKSRAILYDLIVKHINSGKRSKKIARFDAVDTPEGDEE
jgi:hypothetical protein